MKKIPVILVHSEPLERRVLLAVSFAFDSSKLIVTATNGADDVRISKSGSNIVARVNGATRTFPAKGVKSLVLYGKDGNDVLRNDTSLPSGLFGSRGDDTLIGGSGNDYLEGATGRDRLRPRDGANKGEMNAVYDVLDYDGATPGRFGLEADVERIDDVRINDDAILNVYRANNVTDRFTVIGTLNAPLKVFGSSGNDSIGGLLPFDAEIHGAAGNDTVFGADDYHNGASVSVYGDAGNDSLSASGEDVSTAFGDGGPGNDEYEVYNSHGWNGPFIDTGGGHDTLLLSLMEVRVAEVTVPNGIEDCSVGGSGLYGAVMIGNELDNKLVAYLNEFLEEVPGATLLGGKGNDTLIGTEFADQLAGEDGNDSLVGYHGNDVLRGGSGDDTLVGGAGRDKLFGQAGKDRLFARDGERDFVDGGTGYDRVERDASTKVTDDALNVEWFLP